MRLVKKLKVQNDLGLHIRPATYIAKLLQPYSSSVFFTHKNETVNARSIMNVLMLTAKKNTIIEVVVTGDDADIVIKKLATAFALRFGEKN